MSYRSPQFEKSICPHDEVTVSVSGGVDSIVATHYLNKYKRVKVFHFNHNLRPQNDKMEQAVRKFCEDFDFELTVENKGEMDFHYESSSVEDCCRQFRLQAIKDNVHGPLVLAHHLDDAIESHFMNFLRGKEDYVPLPFKTELDKDTFLLRPFVLSTKQQFINYADDHGLWEYIVTDETNKDLSIRRNWVRHKILPEIEKEYKGLTKVVRKKVLKFLEKFEEEQLESSIK